MTNPPEIHIRILDSKDLSEIARVHTLAFPIALMTRLGAKVVERYYDWQISGPHECVPLGAFVEGKLAGFCFAGVFRGATGGFVRRDWKLIAVRLLVKPWLFFDREVRQRVKIGADILFRRQRKSIPLSISLPRFCILSIATDPAFQGKGIGKVLLNASEAQAKRKNHPGVSLAVHHDNTQAVNFYLRNGYQVIQSEGKDDYMARYFEIQ